MLRELHIRNFAIIEEQCISFGPGLNVISGETGSGKSIILGALELALGGKGKPGLIRAGEECLDVSALIDLSSIPESVASELPEIARSDELAVSRSLSGGGRGKVYVNGRLGSVSMLSDIMGRLVNICAQNHHVRLLDPKYHLELIDGYAGNEKLVVRYRDLYREFRRLERLLANFQDASRKRMHRMDELEGIVEELSSLRPFAGMRDQLENEVRRLANAEKLLVSSREISGLIEEDPGLSSLVRELAGHLNELRKLDDGTAALQEIFDSARVSMEEFEREIRRYASTLELNEDLLSEKREALAQVAAMERKYRTNDAGLEDLLVVSVRELEEIRTSEDESSLVKERDLVFAELGRVSEQLSTARRTAGERIAGEAASELAELNMKGAVLEACFSRESFGPDGVDRLEMRISTNRGEPLKSLRDIASGGELSRILLVLKKILRDRSGVNVLVFDEVDSGVSGSVARAVGEKLKALAEHSQVICITHLAQIASLAECHLLVEKRSGKRTTSSVRRLDDEERVEEIARMLAGHTITESTRASARELIGADS